MSNEYNDIGSRYYCISGVAEWALGCEVLEPRFVELVGVLFPSWLQLEVVLHVLMSEEKLFVAPLAGVKGSVENEVADVGLCASELCGLVHGIDLVQFGVALDALELVDKGSVVLALQLGWEEVPHGPVWGESKGEWELWFLVHVTSLVESGEVGETDFLDEVGVGGELGSEQVQGHSGGGWDVVDEVV